MPAAANPQSVIRNPCAGPVQLLHEKVVPGLERGCRLAGMRDMPVSVRVRRSVLGRLAFALAVVAQLSGGLLAPAAEAHADRSTRAHVEQGGTRLHHVHVESLCPVCSAPHLFGPAPAPGGAIPHVARYAEPLAATAAAPVPQWRFDPTAPRAPPFPR